MTELVVWRCPECGDVEVVTQACVHPDETGHLQRVQRERISVIPKSEAEALYHAGEDLRAALRTDGYDPSTPAIERWDEAVKPLREKP